MSLIKNGTLDEDVKPAIAFWCGDCGKGFFFESFFLEHVQEHHNSSTLATDTNVKEEQAQDTIGDSNVKPEFWCSKCGEPFFEESRFFLHLKEHEMLKATVVVDEGSNGSQATGNVSESDAIPSTSTANEQSDKQRYSCSQCDYKCSKKANLKRHIRAKHTDERPYKQWYSCSQCDFTCSNKSNLKRHTMARHTVEREYFCSQCDYKCARKEHLNRHIMSRHTDKRPFSCSHCDYKCVQKVHLNQHIRAKHTDERPSPYYSCSKCDYKCARKSHLNRHIIARHTVERPFSCSQCYYKGVQKVNLNRHIRNKHTNEHTRLLENDSS